VSDDIARRLEHPRPGPRDGMGRPRLPGPGIRPSHCAVNRPKVEQATDHPDQVGRWLSSGRARPRVVHSGISSGSSCLPLPLTCWRGRVVAAFIGLPVYFID